MKKEFKNHYSKKIVTLKGLEKILGKRPRKKKVILCHGNFDVVHPGYIKLFEEMNKKCTNQYILLHDNSQIE